MEMQHKPQPNDLVLLHTHVFIGSSVTLIVPKFKEWFHSVPDL